VFFVGGQQYNGCETEQQNTAAEIETLAASVPDNGGVYFVPALTGLGAPHWDQYARGAILGLQEERPTVI
jgi:glycerol kinase